MHHFWPYVFWFTDLKSHPVWRTTPGIRPTELALLPPGPRYELSKWEKHGKTDPFESSKSSGSFGSLNIYIYYIHILVNQWLWKIIWNKLNKSALTFDSLQKHRETIRYLWCFHMLSQEAVRTPMEHMEPLNLMATFSWMCCRPTKIPLGLPIQYDSSWLRNKNLYQCDSTCPSLSNWFGRCFVRWNRGPWIPSGKLT